MGFISRSFVSFSVLLGAFPLISGLSIPEKRHVAPRQATPGFDGCLVPDGWKFCNDKNNRKCWMVDDKGFEYNITTDYEDFTPIGKERVYNLELTEEPFTADGTVKQFAKLINKKYPGELIEACWGDTLVVNVKNSIAGNGTSMHWHGIRQLGTNHMDGVNGLLIHPPYSRS